MTIEDKLYVGSTKLLLIDAQSHEDGAEVVDFTGMPVVIDMWIPGERDPVRLTGTLIGTTVISYQFLPTTLAVGGQYRFQPHGLGTDRDYPGPTIFKTVYELGT